MAGLIHLVRGIDVLVPREMTRAAGFYNTLLMADQPAVVVEVLNGYRVKERVPDKISEFTLPLVVREVVPARSDVSIVTYGACCRIALVAADSPLTVGVEEEVIYVQSLQPFDIHLQIL